MASDTPPPTATAGANAWRWSKIALLAAVVAAGIFAVASGWHRLLSVEALIKHRSVVLELVDRHFVLALASFMAIYVAAVALSLPGATLLTLIAGAVFGWRIGSVAAVVAATIGGTLIFLLARSVLHDLMRRKAGPRIAKLAEGFRRDAFGYLLSLRLVPVFPFWLVNLAAALLGVPLGVFAGATLIGIVPGTVTFALVGSGLDGALAAQEAAYRACVTAGQSSCRPQFDLKAAITPQILIGLSALGALALVPAAVRRWRAAKMGARQT